MNNLLLKVKNLIKEKRFYKAVKKKLYPYFKGFLLFFSSKSNKIEIFIPKENIIDTTDLPLAKKIFQSYKIMKSEQKNVSNFYKPSSLWQNHIDKDFKFLKNSFDNNDIEKFLFFLQNFGNWNNYLGIENQTFIKKFSRNLLII